MNKQRRETPWEPWDGEYIGNIWGWKYSFISLGIILFFLFIALYRFATLEKPVKSNIEKTEIQVDSINK